MMSTAMIIDTGASLHLENYTGEDGYKGLRCPSSTNISTAGMTERSPVDFEGRHVQYVLGDAPGYEVIQLERPNVAMRSDFRKALWSPSVAFKESGIESYFNARPHLKLPDGRRIPVLEVDYVYALPRWTSSAHAERARSVLLQDKALYACLRAWLDPPARPWASYLDQPVEPKEGLCAVIARCLRF
ncbi:hypothetical protein AB1Y20_012729 [Prymnesium parvum]|uniref:Peptidase A2 domain-containing protein n=1 Tax=Prymnesium parvum TaxID=97485 RepID=A0AB34ILE4_PRYPA